jgi:uncharacterized protein
VLEPPRRPATGRFRFSGLFDASGARSLPAGREANMAEADIHQARAEEVRLAPVTGRDRIDILDVLRGIAILGIFYMNIPFMGGTLKAEMIDIRYQGWTLADQWAWSVIAVVAEGTQRGTLEFLFGAGMMILTAKAMRPDGPVAVADLYMRRTLWLLAFGMADVFLLLWPGDILHIYALAALFLFPFRKLPPKALVALGLIYATATAIPSAIEYGNRFGLIERVEAAQASQRAGKPLTAAQTADLADWNKKLDRLDMKLDAKQRKADAEEVKARTGGLPGYATWIWAQWMKFATGSILFNVAEAFSAMLIGIALFKWGVIQGARSRRFYLVMAIAAYGFGMGARALGVSERFTFYPGPKTIWFTEEYARLAVSLGHVAFANLLFQTGIGRALLAPFRAAGRTAFSLYVCETLIGIWLLFPGFGLGLWNRFGWAGLAGVATAVIALLLVVANVWTRFFSTGPLEWAWRSLAYWKRQPFRARPRAEPIVVGP